jgi:hypothetical protein
MPQGDAQAGDAYKGKMATSRRGPCVQTERRQAGRNNHHEHGRKDQHRHRMLIGTPRPMKSRAAPSSAAPQASRAPGGNPLPLGCVTSTGLILSRKRKAAPRIRISGPVWRMAITSNRHALSDAP